MFKQDANRILTLVSEAGKIDGRKKFQKIVFIIQAKGGNIPERFKYHYYGPFSSDLQMEIDDLVDHKVLIEDNSGSYFSYKLSPQASDFDVDDDILKMKDLIQYLNKIDAQKLELISTIYFLKQEGCKEESLIQKKIKILKPHLIDLLPDSIKKTKEIDVMVE